jgi:hypothetical protein
MSMMASLMDIKESGSRRGYIGAGRKKSVK